MNIAKTKLYRGVEFWTVDTANGPWLEAHNGYFSMYIPNVDNCRKLTALFKANGGENALPNGGRFSYLVMAGAKAVAGFDGLHSHNIRKPLTQMEAERQAMVAIDFLLDNALGFIFPARAFSLKRN